MEFYKKTQNQFGLPLDNRKDYTKLDWITWTATLTQNRADFEALIDPVYAFLNDTPDRSPMTDWYQTKTAKKVGFTARPVVGGVFAQMLYDKATWKKWASRDKTKASNWAPMPQAPKMISVVPGAEEGRPTWRYTTNRPPEDWFNVDFADRTWTESTGGFGTRGTPGARVRTTWSSSDIWLRREFTLTEVPGGDLQLWMHHDEDTEVYINGVPAAKVSGYTSDYEETPMSSDARSALKPGKNVMAVHCHQTGGGQYIDVGISKVEAAHK
jgi:hypothetical protein